LHGSETWPVRKENVVALQRAEMRMVRWMCGVKLKDRLPSKELRERLGVDDIALVLQHNRLRWYGHVLRKDDDDCVKKCMEHEVEGSRPRGRRTLGSNFLRRLFVALNHMSITNSLCFRTHSSLVITFTLQILDLSSCRTIM